MGGNVTELRVLVAGPSDVDSARSVLPGVIEAINGATDRPTRLRLVTSKQVPPQAGRPQELINAGLGIADDIDIFIGILWTRFGTPTGVARSGTEEEFSRCMDSWRKKKSPQIMLYFCDAPQRPSQTDHKQLAKVRAFIKKVVKDQEILFKTYEEHPEFERLVREDLTQLLNRWNSGAAASGTVPPSPAPHGSAQWASFFLRQVTEILTPLETDIFLASLGLSVTTDPGALQSKIVSSVKARLERCRRSNAPLRSLFSQDIEDVPSSPNQKIRIQLLASLIRLYDGLESTGADEIRENPGKLQLIYRVRGDSAASHQRKVIAQADARSLFTRLFAALPWTFPAAIPWVMVELVWVDAQEHQERRAVWEDWWQTIVAESDIQFADLSRIANQLKVHPALMMDAADCRSALEVIKRNGYRVPPEVPLSLTVPPAKTLYPISSDKGRTGFIEALSCAKISIVLFGSDGLSYPQEVYDVLRQKLLRLPDPVRVSLFLIEGNALAKLEHDLPLTQARYKVNIACDRWKVWAADLLVEAQDADHRRRVQRSFELVFAPSPQLGLLNGSLLVDETHLRLNVHETGKSSSSGVLLDCPRLVNVLALVKHYIHEIRRFGRRWDPWSDEVSHQ